MADDRPEEGLESLQKSIDRLELKQNTLEELKAILRDLDNDRGVDLNIINANNSSKISVTAKCDRMRDAMEELAEIDSHLHGEAFSPEHILYMPEKEVFKIKRKFTVDR